MLIEDVILESELSQDDWTLSRPTFGDSNQLTVVGWRGKRKSDKYYILHCSICSQDEELNLQGYFKTLKFSLTRETFQYPCGCAKHSQRTERQFSILCMRSLKLLGMEFRGWAESGFNKGLTRVRAYCPIHELEKEVNISDIITSSRKGGCRLCGDKAATEKRRKDVNYFIEDFKSNKFIPEGTEFKFLKYIENKPVRLWEVVCGKCNTTFIARTGSLQAGKMLCGCNYKNQTYAYINEIYSDELLLGLKFGISVNPALRSKQLDRQTDFNLVLTDLYHFESSSACIMAEKECLVSLPCGIFSKNTMQDGFSETTYPHYRQKLVKIYEKYGGNRIDIGKFLL